MRKKVIVTAVVTIITISLVFIVYFFLNGNPIKKEQAEAQVENYLINVKKYDSHEILSIRGTYSLVSDQAPYGANVSFSDEPQVIYSYAIFKDGKIIQDGYNGDSHKHYDGIDQN
ncbi:DUF3139 domain-containing protein [Paenibacillus sp. SGZ-1009]|uniref:DUF3139 domain-containing protein n=1 Tax=Paenibacillus campi TaxID=3106031 RepID=UPI002AFE64B1|nr:DUF3139 domain-containing protein [Paenibacillus sp. SGZ-1009]